MCRHLCVCSLIFAVFEGFAVKRAFAIEFRQQGCAVWFTIDWLHAAADCRRKISGLRQAMRRVGARGQFRVEEYEQRKAAGVKTWARVAPTIQTAGGSASHEATNAGNGRLDAARAPIAPPKSKSPFFVLKHAPKTKKAAPGGAAG